MSTTNPQIDAQLDKLAELCCQSLDGEQSIASEDSDALLKAMLMSGYARMEGRSLQQDIETRVKDKCRDSAMHRGGELSAMTAELSRKFSEMKRWESRQPEDRAKPQAANISAVTDS